MSRTFISEKEILEFITTIPLLPSSDLEIFLSARDVFCSDISDDPKIMGMVLVYFHISTNQPLPTVIYQNFEDMMDQHLSLYKFAILIGMKGPVTEEFFSEFVLDNLNVEKIANVAKHIEFPPDLRAAFFTKSNDPLYLPEKAQDIFIF